MSLITSIQVGPVRSYGQPGAADPQDQPWTTATAKDLVPGPIWMSREGLAGDEHADLQHHGGPDKAVLVYSADHYPLWRDEIFPHPLPPGAFGENFTVSGLAEPDVCIGDIYSLGAAVVQVSQPRRPCWKQARRWRIPDLVVRMIRSCRPGWYLRVLEEGDVQPGRLLELRERPHPAWPVSRAHHVMHFEKTNPAAAAELADCAALSGSWKSELLKRTL
ncbi:MAG: MOSC domain-containing protein [Bryobacterales bacterium]|nr:MOSC domain-containing protein [Bryobacterales bacterium]